MKNSVDLSHPTSDSFWNKIRCLWYEGNKLDACLRKKEKTDRFLWWRAQYELWRHLIIAVIKEIKSSSAVCKGEWGCEERNLWTRYSSKKKERILPDPPQAGFSKSLSARRQLWGDAFISLMHCITAGLLEKAPVSVRLDEKDPDWILFSSEQIRILWAATHLQLLCYSLKRCEWLSTPLDLVTRVQPLTWRWGTRTPGLKPIGWISLKTSSWGLWWSENKHD